MQTYKNTTNVLRKSAKCGQMTSEIVGHVVRIDGVAIQKHRLFS